MQEFIKIHPQDNVAVALCPLSAGSTFQVDSQTVILAEDIPQGHKFTLTPLSEGEQVIKYGSPIGFAKVVHIKSLCILCHFGRYTKDICRRCFLDLEHLGICPVC